MSKHFPAYTVSGLVLTLIAVPLVFFVPGWIPALVALAGYFTAMKEFSKFTAPLQFITQFLSAAVAGTALWYPFESLSLIPVALLFTALATFGRITFFRTFGYTSYVWFEPLLFLLGVGAWLAHNLLLEATWATWALPLPAFGFASIITWGIIKDKKQLLGVTSKGYKIAIGAEAPEFELPDQNGEMVKLSDFRGKRHLLVIFVRGDWCPGCHMMLRTYQREAERFRAKNIHVLSIGPDPAGVNKDMVERLGLDFKVLSDEGQKTAMIYGVQMQEYDNDFAEKYEEGIPLPASFLVDKNGKVQYVSRPDRVGEFLNPSLIFPIIEKLN